MIKNAGRSGSPLRVSIRPLEHGVHGLRVTISKGGVHQLFRLYFHTGSSTEEWTSHLEAFGQTNHGKRGKNVRVKGGKNRRNGY